MGGGARLEADGDRDARGLARGCAGGDREERDGREGQGELPRDGGRPAGGEWRREEGGERDVGAGDGFEVEPADAEERNLRDAACPISTG